MCGAQNKGLKDGARVLLRVSLVQRQETIGGEDGGQQSWSAAAIALAPELIQGSASKNEIEPIDKPAALTGST